MPRQLAAALAIASAAVSLPSSTAAAAASWRAPVPGSVVRAFAYSPRTPFARGARRGVELSAARGERVVAPCSGPITFRGAVPRFGPGLTIRCGGLVATLLGARGTRAGFARRGAPVAIAMGDVRLGARRAGERSGYVDPLALIGAERPPHAVPLGPAPVAGRSRPVEPRPAPPAPGAGPRPRPGLPWTAWAGIGCALGSLLGPWAISTSRRRSTTSTPRRTLVTRTR